MSEQIPKALMLADQLEKYSRLGHDWAVAQELRRLAAVEAELAAAKAQVEAMTGQVRVLTASLQATGVPKPLLDKLIAEAGAQPSLTRPAVPEGWKLVPEKVTALMAKRAADAWLDCHSRLILNKSAVAVAAGIAAAPTPERAAVMEFDAWWNSAASDNFRARYKNMDGEIFRPVWNAAMRASTPQPD